MDTAEKNRFDTLYQQHLRALKLRGMAEKTIEGYSRGVRRLAEHFDCCPDRLTREQLQSYFVELVASHSWSTIKIDRNGLQFFWRYVLEQDWQWLNIVKAPIVKTIPDVLTVDEVARLLGVTRNLRYRIFFLTAYSMGLRLGETLSLHVGDIDAARMQVHIRCGKGHKDRLVPLPEVTLHALRQFWSWHRHPVFLFPNSNGTVAHARLATAPMDRGSVQAAMKASVADSGIKKKYRSIRCGTVSRLTCLNKA